MCISNIAEVTIKVWEEKVGAVSFCQLATLPTSTKLSSLVAKNLVG